MTDLEEYEAPQLIDLKTLTPIGYGQGCEDGSTDAITCQNGGNAGGSCQDGTNPTTDCSDGSNF